MIPPVPRSAIIAAGLIALSGNVSCKAQSIEVAGDEKLALGRAGP